MKIIPIASGKGGVGKSSIAANLAVLLSKKGKSVTLIDMDLGGSNLHLLLGIRTVEKGIGSYLVDGKLSLEAITIQTEYENLSFIAGDSGIPGLANIGYEQKKALIKEILKISADYVIIDLGAGTTFNTLDFFLISGQGIIVTAPTMAATLTAYLFIKNAIFRIISSNFPLGSQGHKLMERIRQDGISLQKLHVAKLMVELKKVDPANYQNFEKTMHLFRPKLIMNLLDEPRDASRAERLHRSVIQYLGIDLENLGVMFRDETQSRALSSGLPVVLYKPECVMSQAFKRITDRVLADNTSDTLLSPEEIEKSYHEALSDAEIDYADKIDSIADLYQNGALSEGDLLETLRVQQFELNQLRKENRWLKHKITELMKGGQ